MESLMDMVEKAGIAAMLACHEQQPVCAPWVDPMERWGDKNDPMRDFWMRIARAAIAAMRDPTDEMWKAAYDLCTDYDGIPFDDGYTAMIDAALGELGTK
jgi:hypothetical protein